MNAQEFFDLRALRINDLIAALTDGQLPPEVQQAAEKLQAIYWLADHSGIPYDRQQLTCFNEMQQKILATTEIENFDEALGRFTAKIGQEAVPGNVPAMGAILTSPTAGLRGPGEAAIDPAIVDAALELQAGLRLSDFLYTNTPPAQPPRIFADTAENVRVVQQALLSLTKEGAKLPPPVLWQAGGIAKTAMRDSVAKLKTLGFDHSKAAEVLLGNAGAPRPAESPHRGAGTAAGPAPQ